MTDSQNSEPRTTPVDVAMQLRLAMLEGAGQLAEDALAEIERLRSGFPTGELRWRVPPSPETDDLVIEQEWRTADGVTEWRPVQIRNTDG